MLLLSIPCPIFLEELKKKLSDDPIFIEFRQNIVANPDNYPDCTVVNDFILKRGRIWLPQGSTIIPMLLAEYHLTPMGGHMGVAKTLARLTKNFDWPRLRKDVADFVVACIDCQHTKYETKRVSRFLCPLTVPCRPWEDLSLDFKGHFSKGIHLGMLPTHHTSLSVAVLFIDIVRKLHGMPRSLVSDHDPLFISRFWRELFRLSGIRLRMSSAYHPQTDRKSEVLNRVVE